MLVKIGIEAVSVRLPLGDLERVWAAWVMGEGEFLRGEKFGEMMARVVGDVCAGVSAEERQKMGFVLGTTKGDALGLVEWMRSVETGDQEAVTLGKEAGRVARQAGIGGLAYAVSTACSSGIAAMADGAMRILDGEARRVVAAAGDEVTSFVEDGFRALKAVASRGAVAAGGCRPFDKARDGLMLGAGAAAVLLGHRRENSLAVISGWGISNDAVHMTAPDATGAGLVRAMEAALQMAGISAEEVDVLIAHGTGTRYNDAMEAAAIREVFLKRGGKGPAVTGMKGLVGHTLAASGLAEAGLGVNILREQVVPGLVGLEETEFLGIDFVRAVRRMRVRHVMKTASGFGGMNAAVILSWNGGG